MKPDRNTASCLVEMYPEIDTNNIIEKKVSNIHHEDHDDAFFVCDLGDVVKKYVRWQKNFPRIVPYYAIKCNPDETMLKLMIGLGAGFDCASKAEIRLMLSLGASPEKIIFANPCKQTSHVRYAKENNIKPVVFDNKEELVKMKKNYPNADLVLRIQTDDSQSVCPFSMKYGAHPDSCQQLLNTAYKMGLNVVGISFHVGSGCTDVQAFVKAIQNARVLFDYAESIGYHFTLLDIGGGFPGTENVDLKFEEIASMVNLALDDLFPKSDFPHVQIIAEPGRYFAASAYTLATNIIAKRAVLQGVPGEEADSPKETFGNPFTPTRSHKPAFMYYVNDGIYGSFNCLFFDHAQVTPRILKQTKQNGVRFSSSIWGPTCDGLDQICEHVMLPELSTGNWIIWEDMGAYTISAGSAFNGFKTTKMFYVISENENTVMQSYLNGKLLPNVTISSATDDSSSSEDDLCGESETNYFGQISDYSGDPNIFYSENCRVPVEA